MLIVASFFRLTNTYIPLQLQIGNKQFQIGNKQFQNGNKQFKLEINNFKF